MKKLENYCSIIFLFLLATTQVKAQSVDVVIRENGTERKESIDLPKSMTYPLDSLLNDWKAKNYIDLYFSRYPKVKEYMDNMVKEAHETGKVRTMFGRMRELPDINSRNFNRRSFAERTAMNTPIQGTAADIIKLAMNKVESILEEKKFKSRLLLQVHDELVLEVVNDELDAIQTLLKETMESIVELHVPLIVDVHNAENWALVK